MEGNEEEAKEDILLLKKLELKRGLPYARKHSLMNSVSTWKALCWRECVRTIAAGSHPWDEVVERALALDNRVVSTGPGSFPSVWLPPEGCQASRQ